MKTIAAQLDHAFRTAIAAAIGFDADPMVSVAQNEKFGDYQANAAMGLAKSVSEKTGAKTNPRAIAEQIKAKLDLGPVASEITLAGPGFINVRLAAPWIINQLGNISADPRLGIESPAHPQTVVIDYSAPNIAKQMHVGHLRSTIIGDAISRILEFHGDHVIRQNHIGDWGTQFGMLIAYLSATENAADSHIEDLDKFYKEARKHFEADPKFADTARETVTKLQSGGPTELALWHKIIEESRRHFQPIYAQLGVRLTTADERGESFYNPMLAPNVTELLASGVAIRSEGAIVVFTEGDEAPVILEKTGGGYGYAATDLAGVRYRVGTLHADRIIYVVGTPQSQHFRQLFAVARKAGWAKDAVLEHAGFGSVLGEDGKMFKARSGESVKLKDLLDEAEQRALAIVEAKNPDLPAEQKKAIAHAVGIGAVKYADLSRDRIGDYTFSWDSMLSFDGNTAPYLQNAYVRNKGIFRKAQATGLEIKVDPAAIKLDSPQELALAKHVLRLGEVLDQVAKELKPHLLCAYLYDLASRFHAFFEHCPVIQSPEPIRSGRLALCDLTAKTIALGLDLLGIEHPDQM
jgi:arginyl-tRNA synthetase